MKSSTCVGNVDGNEMLRGKGEIRNEPDRWLAWVISMTCEGKVDSKEVRKEVICGGVEKNLVSRYSGESCGTIGLS